MTKKKKWRRVELPEVDTTEVANAFDDAVGMQTQSWPSGRAVEERIVVLNSLKSRVLRVLRAVRKGRVYVKKR